MSPPQKRKPEVNPVCTGSRKLVLGMEGIFLHYLMIHKEGRKKLFKLGVTPQIHKPEVNPASRGSECYMICMI